MHGNISTVTIPHSALPEPSDQILYLSILEKLTDAAWFCFNYAILKPNFSEPTEYAGLELGCAEFHHGFRRSFFTLDARLCSICKVPAHSWCFVDARADGLDEDGEASFAPITGDFGWGADIELRQKSASELRKIDRALARHMQTFGLI